MVFGPTKLRYTLDPGVEMSRAVLVSFGLCYAELTPILYRPKGPRDGEVSKRHDVMQRCNRQKAREVLYTAIRKKSGRRQA